MNGITVSFSTSIPVLHLYSFLFSKISLTNAYAHLQRHLDACYLGDCRDDGPFVPSRHDSSEGEGSDASPSPSPRPSPGQVSTSYTKPPFTQRPPFTQHPPFTQRPSRGPVLQATISLGGVNPSAQGSRVVRPRSHELEEIVEDSTVEEEDIIEDSTVEEVVIVEDSAVEEEDSKDENREPDEGNR